MLHTSFTCYLIAAVSSLRKKLKDENLPNIVTTIDNLTQNFEAQTFPYPTALSQQASNVSEMMKMLPPSYSECMKMEKNQKSSLNLVLES